jgi:hypothetical protein
MTALSKATLKNIWKARFQPQASDFSNLIDSWTDYSVPLETLAAAVSGGSVGVPLYTSAASVTMVAASAAAVAGIPIFTASPSAGDMPIGSQMFYATRFGGGMFFTMQSVGAASPSVFANTGVYLKTYQGSAGTIFSNFINAEMSRGTPAAPLAVPTSTNVLQIRAIAQGDSGGLTGAEIRARTVSATSAAANIEFMFYIADNVSGASSERQMRIRKGAVNFEPKVSAIATPVAGDVYYDSGTNKLRCWNGTSWNDLF